MNFKDFSAVARADSVQAVRSILPETSAPVQQISKVFPFQSYFDSTLLQNAILPQPTNEVIVASTVQELQMPGYAIGLHPSSQTPVAIQFKVGGQPTSSQAIFMKPGQIVRPFGLPRGHTSGAFSGFRWGLPFGWLGGGLATLLVFPTSDADAAWPGQCELIYQRQRMQIVADAALAGDAPLNWPMRFPWSEAFQGSTAISQQGQPVLAITPTKVIMRLRLNSLAAPETMRIIFQGTNDFDLDSAGSVVLTPTGFIEHTWGTYAASAGAGDLATSYPYVEFGADSPLSRLAADDGGIQLVDMTGDITGAFVDVVRYGVL